MSAEQPVHVTLGLGKHTAVKALIDGTVKPHGIELTCLCDFPEPSVIVMFDRILNGELDGGEMSLSFYTQGKLKGAPFIGIPVFPFRSFRHRSIYIRDGAGIKTPADLKGKRIGLHSYSASTMTWVRGILRDDYGVHPRDISWHTILDRGIEGAKRSGVSVDVIPSPGPGVDLIEYVADMIERSELDGGVSPADMTRPGISRLFPNFAEVEGDYYRRTGIFPIIHTLVLNERIVSQTPWVTASLLDSFRKAASLTPQYVAAGELQRWDKETWEVDRPILAGDDPFACGLGAKERRTVEAFLDYLLLDGAIATKPSVDVLFPVS